MRIDRRQAESQIVPVAANCGPRVAEHSHPVGLRGTLLVAVDSSVWLTEIVHYGNREILERVQHAMGKDMVKRFRSGLGDSGPRLPGGFNASVPGAYPSRKVGRRATIRFPIEAFGCGRVCG